VVVVGGVGVADKAKVQITKPGEESKEDDKEAKEGDEKGKGK